MQSNPWVTAGGYILAALVAGGFLLWNNRQRPHETLKVMVEIHEKLPESTERDKILAAINSRIEDLTVEKKRWYRRRRLSDLDVDLRSSLLGALALGIIDAFTDFAVAVAQVVRALLHVLLGTPLRPTAPNPESDQSDQPRP
ncbi:hypothetical protein SEA_WRIGLEY_34 [Gordonia phage Wrigley]|nr:hypothetical protein SEA_WRIGLEY_34 [Gordonia phage Wrigley]